jgi:hypothetical protein
MSKAGIVNVRMVITEEKILSNIDKIQKMINPNSKKQIVQLEEDTYFKDMIESVKAYLIEYPKKKNFPVTVYRAAYGLVEYATNQFEENTKRIEELIRSREENISTAGELKELLEKVEEKEENWSEDVKNAKEKFGEDIIESLNIVGNVEDKEDEEYKAANKLLNARINNLESNLHIEIDMERIEDRSKALSYIGIEVADALKGIPTPIDVVPVVEETEVEPIITEEPEQEKVQTIQDQIALQEEEYRQETTFEAKPSLWQRIKNSKFVRTIRYITKIRVRLDYSALPEGRGENK